MEHDPTSLAEGERRRDEGIAAVVVNPEEQAAWVAAFDAKASALLRIGHRRITSDDVIGLVGLPPGHRNAVGAAMRSFAVRSGLRNIGTVKSARVDRHAGRITVWERL